MAYMLDPPEEHDDVTIETIVRIFGVECVAKCDVAHDDFDEIIRSGRRHQIEEEEVTIESLEGKRLPRLWAACRDMDETGPVITDLLGAVEDEAASHRPDPEDMDFDYLFCVCLLF